MLCVSLSPFIHLSYFLFLSFYVSVYHPASISFYLSMLSGDPGSISGSGRSPGEGNGHPLQDCCLGRGALPGYSPWSCKRIGHNWVSNSSIYTSVTYLSNLPTYIYPSIMHISNHVFLSLSFHPSIHHLSSLFTSFIIYLYLPTYRQVSITYLPLINKWVTNTSIYTSMTYLSNLPTYIYPTIMHISSFSFLPYIYPSIIYSNCLPHLSSIYIDPPTDMYPSPMYHLSSYSFLTLKQIASCWRSLLSLTIQL